MNFFARPFVFLTPIFCLGILLEDEFNWFKVLCAVMIVSSVVLVVVRKSERLRALFSIFSLGIGVMLLGTLLLRFTRSEFMSVSEITEDKEIGAIVEVLEVDKRDVIWRKVLAEISFVVGSDTMVPHHEKILFYTNERTIERYDLLYVLTKYKPIRNSGNPGEFDAEHYWNGQNVRSMGFLSAQNFLFIDGREPTLLEALREKMASSLKNILQVSLNEDEQAVAIALILGDKTLLSPETKKQFSSAGAMHVLAVSGLHVGIILEILIFLLGRFPRFISRSGAMITALVIIWIYAALINFPSSVVRAGLMFSFLVIGRLIGRDNNGLNVLFLSAFIMLLIKPLWIYDIGFQLSYLAMIGILTLYKPIATLFYLKNKWLKKVWEGTAVGIAAQLFTLPVTLYYFHQFPNYFLLTNIGMMVFAGLVLGLGLSLFVFKWIPIAGSVVATALGFVLLCMITFVAAIDALPGAVARAFVLPSWIVILGYAVLLSMVIFRRKKVFMAALGVAFVLLGITQYSRLKTLYSSEVVVMNSNNLVMIIKERNQLMCVHSLNDENITKVKILAEAYRNVKGGELTYHRIGLGESTIDLGGTTHSVTRILDGFLIRKKASKKEYFVRAWHDAPPLDREQIIDLPYQTLNKYYRNLREGAIVLDFN